MGRRPTREFQGLSNGCGKQDYGSVRKYLPILVELFDPSLLLLTPYRSLGYARREEISGTA